MRAKYYVRICLFYFMKYVKGLDTLRAIAVLLVIHEHWGPGSFKFSSFLNFILKILPSGSFAVNFFFVLSGFLITGILIEAKNDSHSKSKILKNFIVRRCLRIFPVYYLCLILLYVLNYHGLRGNFIHLVTYTENFHIFYSSSWDSFSHTWSLAVEEQFYVIWPIIILFIPNRYIFKILILFIVAGTILCFITVNRYGSYAVVLPFNCFNAFAIGGIYSYAIANNKILFKLKQILFLLLFPAIILYVLLECDFIAFPSRIIDAIISINLIICVVEKRYGNFFSVIINNNILSKLGKISYGIYLFHYCIPYYYDIIVKYLDRKFVLESHFKTLLYQPSFAEMIQFIALVSISYVSYHFIESRFLKLKKYFNYNNKLSLY
jgi:peptidoglycan/LPS O-acetylase OafA/YrhL